MKKTLILLLALVLCLSLCACGGNDDEAFNTSREAFTKITKAYAMFNEYSQDIYTAWYLGVHNPGGFDGYKGYDYQKYNRKEFDGFCDKMNIDRTYIEESVVKLSNAETFNTGSWYALGDLYNGSFYSAWVSVIAEAYAYSGKEEGISSLLNDSKLIIKALGEEHSDYEHYPVLKEYFTNALEYFDFCQNPEGSLEQVEELFKDFQDVERECFYDLNYVFEDSSSEAES